MSTEQIKVVIIGDETVGKTSILKRYVTNTFAEYSTATLGAAFSTRTIEIGTRPVKLNLWDTAGQERYHSLASLYTRNAKIIILVYDITNRSSFESIKTWYSTLQKEGLDPNCIFGLFGNKEDLVLEEQTSLEEAKKFSTSINALFVKTSAKLNTGIEAGISCLSEKYLSQGSNSQDDKSSFLLSSAFPLPRPYKSRCCK